MQSANRPVERTAPRRRRNVQLAVTPLEQRQLLAIDLSGISGSVAGLNPPGPFGVLEAGQQINGGAGWSVALVGDVNGDAFQDFVVGAPGIAPGAGGGFPTLAAGQGRVFLILGSNPANAPNTNIDWATLASDARIGDLTNLGNLQQTNPLTNQPGFPFNGLVFTAGQNPQNNLGASVSAAGDVNQDGLADFLIGAPGGNDQNGLPGTGRAYLVYGSVALGARATKQVDLDNPSAFADLRVVTFTNVNQPGSQTGRGVAGVGDVITDGVPDIAIGAPGANVTGLAGQGAVYLISGAALPRPAQSGTVVLNTIGQAGGVPGFILAGVTAGDQFGFSVAGAGNTTGRTDLAGRPTGDLLIGAPGNASGTGAAALFYGDRAQTLQGYTTTVGGLTVIPGGQIGSTVPGAIFLGSGVGSATGFSVSTAGDFNGDALADILIGSPGFSQGGLANAGRVNLIYGRAATPANPGIIQGLFNLNNLPGAIRNVDFQGASANALAGFSVTATGRINNDNFNEIAIGSPGAGTNGQAYIISGNTNLTGTQSLAATETTLFGLIVTSSAALTNTPGPYLIGTGVSGLPLTTSPTIDGDGVGDLILGGAGFALNASRGVAGGVWGLEGRFLSALLPVPPNVPPDTDITTQIGIDGQLGQIVINLNQPQPATLQVIVLSTTGTTPAFAPLTDIDLATTTLLVNGQSVPLNNVTLAINATNPPDLNNDGIPDAVITFTPRPNLGAFLIDPTSVIAVEGTTLATSPLAGRTWSGSTLVTVIPTRIVIDPSDRLGLLGIGRPNVGVPDYGERFIPSPAILSKLNWQRLSPHQRFQQFLPEQFFAGRFRRFYHGPYTNDGLVRQSRSWDTGAGVTTLGRKVFSRGQYPAGVVDFRRIIGKPVRAGARLNAH